MPKRKGDTLDNSTARDIYAELNEYGKTKQFIPLQNSLFAYMTEPHYEGTVLVQPRYPELTQGSFYYWFNRLCADGYIMVDPITNSIRAESLIITEREE